MTNQMWITSPRELGVLLLFHLEVGGTICKSFQPLKSEHYWQEKVLKHCWPIGRKEKKIKYNIGKPAEFRIVHSNEENK